MGIALKQYIFPSAMEWLKLILALDKSIIIKNLKHIFLKDFVINNYYSLLFMVIQYLLILFAVTEIDGQTSSFL